MLVEDAADLAAVVGVQLEHEGYTVRYAASLAQARASMAERVPAAVLLDLRLPDGDGLDLLGEMRAADQLAAVPVIVVSARQPPDADPPEAGTPTRWLVKPFRVRELMSSLQRAVRAPGRARVLVVEDDDELRAVRAREGEGPGAAGAQAGDGVTALRLAAEPPPAPRIRAVAPPRWEGTAPPRQDYAF